MTLQAKFSQFGRGVKHHAPELLAAAGVTGLAVTAWLSGKAGFRAGLIAMADVSQRIDDTPEGEETVFMTPQELIKETWKFYIPAIGVGAVTAVAIVGGNRISNSRQLALISAAAIGERAFQEYREKLVETTSRPKEQKVRDDVAQDKVNEKKDEISRLIVSKDGDALVIETHTKQVFVSSAEKIYRAENAANRISNHDGYISLNVFLDQLGLPSTPAGEVVGWSNEKPLEVRLGGAVHEDKPILTIDYVTPPSVTYMNPF
jgi:hypothetical protein